MKNRIIEKRKSFYQGLTDELNSLESKIKASLALEIMESETESKHIQGNCLRVNVYDYEELILIQSRLVFLDSNGLHYDLFAECTIYDLVNILNDIHE